MNLFGKVLLTLALTVSVALAVAGLLAGRGANRAAQSYAAVMIQQQAASLAAEAGVRRAAGETWPAIQAWIDAPGGMMAGGMMGNGAGHMAQARSRRGMMGGRAFTLVAVDSGAPLAPEGEPVGADALALALPVEVKGATVALLAPVLLPSGMTAAGEAFVAQVNQAVLLAALAAGLMALVAGGLLAASILRPLRRVEQTVARIERGDLSARVAVQSSDEIGRLAAGVNAMAATLEQQEQLRQRLVADIAHELRTPLSVVQGNLQAMLDGVYPLSRDEVQTVYDETRLLTRIITDLHDVAQAEARRLRLAIEPVDAASALNALADRFRPLADAQQIALQVEAAPGLILCADPERLHQVLHNLVGNALRHTPPSGIVELAAASAGGFVRLSVRDSGPGIDPADLPHIFDRFYRAERDRARSTSTSAADSPPPGSASADAAPAEPLTAGAGLGLAIAKALVQAMGGRIRAESSPGHGATLIVELPGC